MFAGSVTRRTSTPVSVIRARVFSSLCAYSSSGNAAIRHLLGRLPVEQQVLEHALSGVDVAEVDQFSRRVGRLPMAPRPEQNDCNPPPLTKEARVAPAPHPRIPPGATGSGIRRVN